MNLAAYTRDAMPNGGMPNGGMLTTETSKVHLPVDDSSDDASPVATEATPATSAEGAEHVLVVEDEDGLRDLIRRFLLRQGYTVHVAANAAEAQQIFCTTKVDLLLTDVVMPGTSGPQLSQMLSAIRPDLKVVYMSGYAEEAIVHHGVLDPGIAFVHKPFTSATLSRKLREALDR